MSIPIRILIVENLPIVAKGLNLCLSSQSDMRVGSSWPRGVLPQPFLGVTKCFLPNSTMPDEQSIY
jgi:hypothetical protein